MLRNMYIIYHSRTAASASGGYIFMRPLSDFVCWMLEGEHQLQMSSELLSILLF